MRRLLCRVIGHTWKYERVVGHVHAGPFWPGDVLEDGTPWIDEQLRRCGRCGATE